jgi:hypothetical protein
VLFATTDCQGKGREGDTLKEEKERARRLRSPPLLCSLLSLILYTQYYIIQRDGAYIAYHYIIGYTLSSGTFSDSQFSQSRDFGLRCKFWDCLFPTIFKKTETGC